MIKNILFFNVFIFLSISFVKSQTTKVIFNEDFGKSTTRIGSQYVPQSGNDSNLEKFDSHGSSFYHLADQYFQEAPNPSKTSRATSNQDVWNIDNGYYAVIAPKNISFPSIANPVVSSLESSNPHRHCRLRLGNRRLRLGNHLLRLASHLLRLANHFLRLANHLLPLANHLLRLFNHQRHTLYSQNRTQITM